MVYERSTRNYNVIDEIEIMWPMQCVKCNDVMKYGIRVVYFSLYNTKYQYIVEREIDYISR